MTIQAGRNLQEGFHSRTFHSHYSAVGTEMARAFTQNPAMAAEREAQIRATVRM